MNWEDRKDPAVRSASVAITREAWLEIVESTTRGGVRDRTAAMAAIVERLQHRRVGVDVTLAVLADLAFLVACEVNTRVGGQEPVSATADPVLEALEVLDVGTLDR